MTNDEYREYILKHFTYHPDGSISRDDRRNSLGRYNEDGYRVVKIKGRYFTVHRIVWLLNTGDFPDKEIDHINRVRDDNRIENLRCVDRLTNVLNRTQKPNPDTGVVGIYLDKSTKGLKAKYSFHFKDKSYRFRNLEDAVNKRKELRKQYGYDRISEIG